MRVLTNRIAGTGLFALDVIIRADGSMAKPTLGGSAGNVLSILGALGWKAVPIGTTGDDSAAAMLRSEFAGLGADLELFRHSKHHCTPVIYQHQLPNDSKDTHRFTFTCPVCGERRRPRWKDEELLEKVEAGLPAASVFFLDRPTPLGVKLAELYAGMGALVIFEPSSVGEDPNLFRQALQVAHIVKYADERIKELDSYESVNAMVEIQTCGANGLRFRAPSLDRAWFSMGGYSLPYVQDTSGAGDWCTAGLIYELFRFGGARGMCMWDYASLVRALAFGQALSSLNCLTEGARGLLSVWSPRRILGSAHELSGLRLRALREDPARPGQRVNESRLAEFADDKRLRTRAFGVGVPQVACCTP